MQSLLSHSTAKNLIRVFGLREKLKAQARVSTSRQSMCT
jgi:hypothetical protein